MPSPMSRIADVFARAAQEKRAALVAYLTAGDPDLASTGRLIAELARAGADVIEVGVPFSDPTADGPTIQRASERALAKGTTLAGVLDAVKAARRETDVAIVLFGYYNPILSYGDARLAKDAKAAGVDGLLVVDLPLDECDVLRAPAFAAGLDWVPLVAPTTSPERSLRVTALATSFVYFISVAGVTGAGKVDLEDAGLRAKDLADRSGKPVAVGFGVRSASDVSTIAKHAAGVVVGSAIVSAIERGEDVEALVRDLRTGCRRSAATSG
jgi:tryptophan synthase alpha chain